jgi:hypothetical protein
MKVVASSESGSLMEILPPPVISDSVLENPGAIARRFPIIE